MTVLTGELHTHTHTLELQIGVVMDLKLALTRVSQSKLELCSLGRAPMYRYFDPFVSETELRTRICLMPAWWRTQETPLCVRLDCSIIVR